MEGKLEMEKNFFKFGGERIDDLGEYVRNYLDRFPGTTVYVGADAAERGRYTLYATVVAFYDEFRKDGVHYIFHKETVPSAKVWVERTGDKTRDKALIKATKEANIYTKIWGEVERVFRIGQYLELELDGIVKRKSMDELTRLGYSSHQSKLIGLDVDISIDPGFKIPEELQSKVNVKGRLFHVDERNDRLISVNNSSWTISLNDLSEEDLKYVIDVQTSQPKKLREYLYSMTSKDVKNKSQLVYEAARAQLEGQGFRVRYKNNLIVDGVRGENSWAANCAADFICDKQKKRRKGKAERKRSKAA